MGLFDIFGGSDRAKDKIAEHGDKAQVGFNPSVCEGCPHRGTGRLKRCGLCGCPTIAGMPMDQLGMAPKDCPRLDEHERLG